MAYNFPGSLNIFPRLDQDMLIMYARNPRSMPLARYALFADTKYQLSYYTAVDDSNAIRIVDGARQAAIWPDGAPRPDGQNNRIAHRFENIQLERHLHNFPHGTISLANQPYDIISRNMIQMAQRAGTLRAIWAKYVIDAAITATTLGSAALSTLSGAPSDISAGTTTNPIFLLALQTAAQTIFQNTNGVINEKYLKVVIPPAVATLLARSAEIRDYVKGSPDAMSVVTRGFSNNRFGLPLMYYGYELIVEDTVYMSSRRGATNVLANVYADKSIYIFARMDRQGASGMDGGAFGTQPGSMEENTFPTTPSTLCLFEGPYYTLKEDGSTEIRNGTYGMGSEVHVDTKNEVVDAGIRDNFSVKAVTPQSGYVWTGVIP